MIEKTYSCMSVNIIFIHVSLILLSYYYNSIAFCQIGFQFSRQVSDILMFTKYKSFFFLTKKNNNIFSSTCYSILRLNIYKQSTILQCNGDKEKLIQN